MKVEDAKKIIDKYKSEISIAPCSVNHHLNKIGGLMEHLKNTEVAALEIDSDNETLLALAMIHDIGKARTYKTTSGKIVGLSVTI